MEKSISQEERIRRAEKIYSRRRYNNRYGESLYRSGETRNRYQPQETRKIKGKMINKMIIQMIVCVIIYTCIYMLQYSNDTTQLAVGGADETQQEEEKSQEEQDIEYVKQNVSIIWPIKGVITSRFGNRTPTEIVTANHKGLDIAGNMGDNIVSAMDGTVVQYSEEGDYGKHLRIQSGEVLTLYAHCSELLVQEGSTVKQGDVIAKVGATGRATGPHLHFEIRRDDRFINPELILGSL